MIRRFGRLYCSDVLFVFLLPFLFFFFCAPSYASSDSLSTSPVTVPFVPDSSVAAGALHRFLFGDLWRDVWILPAAAPLFDPTTAADGPVRIHARPDDPDDVIRFGTPGSEFTFTPLLRSSSARFGREFHELFTEAALTDLSAMMHPYAPLMTARLLEAAGVEHVRPMLVVLEDRDSGAVPARPSSYTPGYLEQWPAGDTLIDSFTLLRRLEQGGADRVDAVGYLTARIMAIVTGDWGEGLDEWKWVRRENGGKALWVPVADCGSRAFSRFDGLIPWTSTIFLPRVDPWGAGAPSVSRLMWAGRHLDRWFLSPLGKGMWDSVTAITASRLSDTVINMSVRTLPSPVREKFGPSIIAALRARRDMLSCVASAYYRGLAQTVDIHGTDEAELVVVTRTDDAHVQIRMTGRDNGQGTWKDAPQCDRVFTSEETGEIRLYLKGGDDRVVLRGTVASSIPVRVIGGAGNDVVIDSSHVTGYWLGLVPFIHDDETCTYVYDTVGTHTGEGSAMAVRDVDAWPAGDTLRFRRRNEDRGYVVDWGGLFDWNSEFGPMVGVGPIITYFSFDERPYRSKMSLLGGVAPFAGVGKVVANAEWRGVLRNAAVTLDAMASGFEMLTYFGRGNETAPVLRVNDPYYRVLQTQLRVEPALRWPADGPVSLTLRTGVRYAVTDKRKEKFVTDERPYGISDMTLLTLGAGVRWDTRDDDVSPHAGFFADMSGAFVPKAFSVGEAFGRVKGDVRAFVTAGIEQAVTISLRVLGDRTWGKVPFFEAATIGSSSALRGYQQGRFAGTASVVGVAEVRVRLGRLDLITPVPFGMFGFAETGRVFEPGEDSRLWHPSFGGGVWAAPWKRQATLTASIGVSKESVMVYGAVGFGF